MPLRTSPQRRPARRRARPRPRPRRRKDLTPPARSRANASEACATSARNCCDTPGADVHQCVSRASAAKMPYCYADDHDWLIAMECNQFTCCGGDKKCCKRHVAGHAEMTQDVCADTCEIAEVCGRTGWLVQRRAGVQSRRARALRRHLRRRRRRRGEPRMHAGRIDVGGRSMSHPVHGQSSDVHERRHVHAHEGRRQVLQAGGFRRCGKELPDGCRLSDRASMQLRRGHDFRLRAEGRGGQDMPQGTSDGEERRVLAGMQDGRGLPDGPVLPQRSERAVDDLHGEVLTSRLPKRDLPRFAEIDFDSALPLVRRLAAALSVHPKRTLPASRRADGVTAAMRARSPGPARLAT